MRCLECGCIIKDEEYPCPCEEENDNTSIGSLVAILDTLNTMNEWASLHDRELWSLHGPLQTTIDKAIDKAIVF